MNFKRSAALLLLTLLSNATTGLETENIVRGEKVKSPKDYPYQVSVQEANEHVCGGALIGLDTVLSAAHCFYPGEGKIVAKRYQIRAGSIDLNDDKAVVRAVSFIHLPQDYSVSYVNGGRMVDVYNDIAVLKLAKPFPERPSIGLVELPASDKEDYIGKRGILTGFGYNCKEMKYTCVFGNDNDIELITEEDGYLYKLYIDIYIAQIDYDKNMFYTGRAHTLLPRKIGACNGDSGGALVVGKKVVGVLSFTDLLCNDRDYPNGYTKVTKYLEWVKDVLNNRENSYSRIIDIEKELKKN